MIRNCRGLAGHLRVHLIELVTNSLPTDVLGWAMLAVTVATLGLGLLLTYAMTRERPIEKKPAEPLRRAELRTKGPMLAGAAPQRRVANSLDLQTMQDRAAQQIDAAEHALNRLLAEYALVATPSVEPAVKPARQLDRKLDAPAQQPIAA